ncbi:MAG TPA: hypothetical protein PKA33_00280 [Amaricoccus sp.]|uniref:hypothetical protein n=1 Tax=Amaricoccus sp. TaxID=1872485 RepID=UPI002CE86D2F|nr:hypothetical protein [Amaricoccus sp.]HMQ92294.1 hypothetical protein [Amaricoccus sp.]HMR51039.1 hypothetical protein [Amaricoccus sp.]HMR61328.1 hypothetical protein [Amaricoccus sp.]HMT97782.1 hypothetical protein [Amaricoccus sp.]
MRHGREERDENEERRPGAGGEDALELIHLALDCPPPSDFALEALLDRTERSQ